MKSDAGWWSATSGRAENAPPGRVPPLRFLRSLAVNAEFVSIRVHSWLVLFALFAVSSVYAQQAGGIRGTVFDKEFDAPLAAAEVSIAETGAKATATDEGNYVFSEVAPGSYTLVFSKEGYTRQVAANVAVSSGQMTDADASLSGDFTEMEEFVAQDLEIGGGTEAGLLNLRMESPAMMDSVSSEFMSRAGAGDAASALRLVSGATVQDGKYAVVRGLPDRYVSSQLNGVRLPTSDADKRSVQLDQFPAPLIESIQVAKTFTPDQQGDASGGAVNVILRGIPDGPVLEFQAGVSYNTQATGNDQFLSYKGGGVNYWGKDDGGRKLPLDVSDAEGAISAGRRTTRPFTPEQEAEYLERDRQTRLFSPVIGVSRQGAPDPGHSWEVTAGNSHTFGNGIRVGALGSFNYDHSYSFYDKGAWNAYLGDIAGEKMVPEVDSEGRTELYQDAEGTEEVLWGALGALGVEFAGQQLNFVYMTTHAATDTARLLEDTTGTSSGGRGDYYRSQAIGYTERDTSSLQLIGKHKIEVPEAGIPGFFQLLTPEVDWTVAESSSELWEPDKRLFYTSWSPDASRYAEADPNGGGIGRRSWRDISEESSQFFINGKIPFQQWTGDEGYFKAGWFQDEVIRKFTQDSFVYKAGPGSVPLSITQPVQPFSDFWSDIFLDPDRIGIVGDTDPVFHNEMAYQILSSKIDADYDAEQNITAWYPMVDLPLFSIPSGRFPFRFNVIGGVRFETTELSTDFRSSDGRGSARFVVEDPVTGQLFINAASTEEEIKAAANTTLKQDDVLPSLGFVFEPVQKFSVRGTYSETIARPTFKELTPTFQYEYLGADSFVGNRDLKISALKNYDLRLEYYPNADTFLSVSWFSKKMEDPIEYQAARAGGDSFIRAVNYPEGDVNGYEFEVRQKLGAFWQALEGFSVQGNLTIMDSEVTLPGNEIQKYEDYNRGNPASAVDIETASKRPMRETPDYLVNTSLLYDHERWGTQVGVFYTLKGDTLVAGGSLQGAYVPDVYADPYGELSIGISQKFMEIWKLSFRAKNILDPEITTSYRSPFFDEEQTESSYTKGVGYSISLGCEF